MTDTNITCPACDGSGFDRATSITFRCEPCNGKGTGTAATLARRAEIKRIGDRTAIEQGAALAAEVADHGYSDDGVE